MKVVNILDESCESFRWKLWKEVIKAVGDSSRGISGSESTMLSHFWPGLPSCPVCTPVHISHLYLCLSYISICFINICASRPVCIFLIYICAQSHHQWVFLIRTTLYVDYFAEVSLFSEQSLSVILLFIHLWLYVGTWTIFMPFSLKEKIENVKRSDLWMF